MKLVGTPCTRSTHGRHRFAVALSAFSLQNPFSGLRLQLLFVHFKLICTMFETHSKKCRFTIFAREASLNFFVMLANYS